MEITTVKKKKYNLTEEEILAINRAIDVLEIINNDNDVREAIQQEVYYGEVGEAQDILYAILNLDGTYIIDY